MKANEFRVGNLIADYELNEDFFAIEEIKKNEQRKLAVYYRNGSCMSIDPEPIPLTEEWLLKFGFEKDDVFDKIFTYLPLHDLCMDKLSFRKSEGFICYDGIKKYRTLLKHIQHVHQLQNLYWCLCGKELVVSDAVS